MPHAHARTQTHKGKCARHRVINVCVCVCVSLWEMHGYRAKGKIEVKAFWEMSGIEWGDQCTTNNENQFECNHSKSSGVFIIRSKRQIFALCNRKFHFKIAHASRSKQSPKLAKFVTFCKISFTSRKSVDAKHMDNNGYQAEQKKLSQHWHHLCLGCVHYCFHVLTSPIT